ncbi:unnamed protein product, partial [marine sediment metagenome]
MKRGIATTGGRAAEHDEQARPLNGAGASARICAAHGVAGACPTRYDTALERPLALESTKGDKTVPTLCGIVLVLTGSFAGAAGLPNAASPTAGIQEAIDALPAGGGVVTLPRGRYVIRRAIVLRSHVTLRGDGVHTV